MLAWPHFGVCFVKERTFFCGRTSHNQKGAPYLIISELLGAYGDFKALGLYPFIFPFISLTSPPSRTWLSLFVNHGTYDKGPTQLRAVDLPEPDLLVHSQSLLFNRKIRKLDVGFGWFGWFFWDVETCPTCLCCSLLHKLDAKCARMFRTYRLFCGVSTCGYGLRQKRTTPCCGPICDAFRSHRSIFCDVIGGWMDGHPSIFTGI